MVLNTISVNYITEYINEGNWEGRKKDLDGSFLLSLLILQEQNTQSNNYT
jgi:hypothetical protein